jgi:hypothetical protein
MHADVRKVLEESSRTSKPNKFSLLKELQTPVAEPAEYVRNLIVFLNDMLTRGILNATVKNNRHCLYFLS